MIGDEKLYTLLHELQIPFEYYEHPPAPTIEEAMKHWERMNAVHCKNLFFRNHKGDKHYLVLIDAVQQMNIHDIEKQLKQGKLSFASEQRMQKYLGLKPGSVSPFGLIHDTNKEVIVFLDENLQHTTRISFHPNINTASLIIDYNDLIRFLHYCENEYHFVKLY